MRMGLQHLWYTCYMKECVVLFNPLNAELNSIYHLLALLGPHHILYVSRIRVNDAVSYYGCVASAVDK